MVPKRLLRSLTLMLGLIAASSTLQAQTPKLDIFFPSIADQLTTSKVTLNATSQASHTQAITYEVTGPCRINNDILEFTGAGLVTVTARQSAPGYADADPKTLTFMVNKAPAEQITLSNLIQPFNGTARMVTVTTKPTGLGNSILYGDQPTAPIATGTYPVSVNIQNDLYQGTQTGLMSIVGFRGKGAAIAMASPPSTDNGTDLGSVAIGRVASTVIELTNPGNEPLDVGSDFTLSLEGAQARDFSANLISDRVIPAQGSLKVELRFEPTSLGLRSARLRMSSSRILAESISIEVCGSGFMATKLPQTLNFSLPATAFRSLNSVNLSANASSDLPAEFSVISGPGRINGSSLEFTGVDSIEVEARQAGNDRFSAAAPVRRKIRVLADPNGMTLVNLVQTYNGLPKAIGVVGAGDAKVNITYQLFPGGPFTTTQPKRAGKYAVKAEASSVTKTGTLLIQPAPLIIRVTDQRRFLGTFDPEVTLPYEVEGLMTSAGDTRERVLSLPPILRTPAKRGSPSGVYPITASGASCFSDYFITYRQGTLTIEGVGGTYETLLRDPGNGEITGHLSVSVTALGNSFSGSLRLSSETAALAVKGPLTANNDSRSASAEIALTSGVRIYSLRFSVTSLGLLQSQLYLDQNLIGQAMDGNRSFTAPRGWTAPHSGTYTLAMTPPQDLQETDPQGSGWASVTVDAAGRMKLTGRLADNTAITATLNPDISSHPIYRVFIQPYRRTNSHLAGSLTLIERIGQAGRYDGAATTMTWTKQASVTDLSYPQGIRAMALPIRLHSWAAPTKTLSLPTLLGLDGAGRMDVSHSATGSQSHTYLPDLTSMAATGVVSVLNPESNPRGWRMTVTPKTGLFTVTTALAESSQVGRLSYSGVLLQQNADPLIGAGFSMLPPLSIGALLSIGIDLERHAEPPPP